MNAFFGRKNENKRLFDAFVRVQKGGFEQAMVMGPAGVGKTALVRQLALTAEKKAAGFVFGKADLRRAGIPLAAVRAALDMMVKKAIADHPRDMAAMADMVSKVFGRDLDRVISLVPALQFLFDDDAPHKAERSREDETPFLNNMLYSLIETFALRFKGLVVFLDDLQWLDAASHKFLAHLAVAPALPKIFLVLGFRSEEALPMPGLSRTRSLYQGLGSCTALKLKGLAKRDVTALLKDRLETCQDVKPLCDLCHEKTNGNPFYLMQMMDDLIEQGAVQQKSSAWAFDIPKINNLGFSENVADLIISRMRLLTEEEVLLLKHGACIQGGIPIETLSVGMGVPADEIETLLWRLIQLNFLEKHKSEYQFSHDKILEAVDSLITPDERAQIHKILTAYYLSKNLAPAPKSSVFTLLHHYGFYRQQITDPDVKIKMVPHYLAAGQLAREQSAYDQALDWLIQGMDHYPGDIWHSDYDLALRFSRLAADCAYLASDFEAAEQIFAEVDEQAHSFDDRIPVEMVKISCYHATDQLEKAFATGNNVLVHLGLDLPATPSWPRVLAAILRTWALFIVKQPFGLPEKKMRRKSRVHQIVKLMSVLGGTTSILHQKKVLVYRTAIAFEHCLKYGNSAQTPMLCIAFGMVLNQITRSAAWGRKLGAVARQISEKHGNDLLKCKEHLISLYFLDHWDEPLSDIITHCEKGMEMCLRQGDHEYFAYQAVFSLKCMLYIGMPLEQILETSSQRESLLKRVNHNVALDILSIHDRTFENLIQGSPEPWELGADLLPDDHFLRNDQSWQRDHALHRFSAAFFCGRSDVALPMTKELEILIERSSGSPLYCYFCFMSALVEIDAGQNRKLIHKRLKCLKQFASNNPGSYQHWYLLALGEDFRIKGRIDKARALFEKAHDLLKEKPHALYDKAMALEKLGQVAKALGKDSAAEDYFHHAAVLYQEWGLKWKHNLFETVDTDLKEPGELTDTLSDKGGIQPDRGKSQRTLESVLFYIQKISCAQKVHAAVLEARQWKSIVYVENTRVHRPAIFIDLPEKMLAFASAAGKTVRATAVNFEEDFFDTTYFFKHQPESLVVIPGGPSKGIVIENPDPDIDIDALTPWAEQVFESLMPQTISVTEQPDKDPREILQLKACCQMLQAYMLEKQAYRDPRLTIALVASNLDISQRILTDAVNICLEQNFQAFVNSYRVEAVKDRIKQQDAGEKNILEIAFEAGFSAKSTFNQTFKAHTGMTPSQYQKSRQWERV